MGVKLSKNLKGEVEVDTSGGSRSIKYSVGNLIMDGDTTTISHIHERVSKEIGVWSNVGCIKKALFSHPMKLSISKTVVDYLVKCFGYVLAQNKGDPEAVREGCLVIINPAFGDQTSCGSWCQYNPIPETYLHQSLPRDKDLEGDDLKADLLKVTFLCCTYELYCFVKGTLFTNFKLS